MNLSDFDWNHNYNQFLDYLYSLQDLKYKDFHSKLILNESNLIGIRTPILKRIAKDISKGNYQKFLKINSHNTYEEKIIHGLVIGYLNLPFEEIIDLTNQFLPFIDNWAINDIVCANLKIFRKNLELGFSYISDLLKRDNPWITRFSLVLLLNFYINDLYIDKVLKICDQVKSDNYYVQMANAWCLSICFIKYPNITYSFLLNNHLDDFTINKAISKICDSYRVDKNVKKQLREIKR